MPEHIEMGQLPIRTEITVVPADDPEMLKIGFKVTEYIGTTVCSAPPGLSAEQVRNKANWPEGFESEPIFEEDALQDESVVLICNGVYTLHRGEDGTLHGTSGGMTGFLEYAPDDRNCWVCGGFANLAGIQRLNLKR